MRICPDDHARSGEGTLTVSISRDIAEKAAGVDDKHRAPGRSHTVHIGYTPGKTAQHPVASGGTGIEVTAHVAAVDNREPCILGAGIPHREESEENQNTCNCHGTASCDGRFHTRGGLIFL